MRRAHGYGLAPEGLRLFGSCNFARVDPSLEGLDSLLRPCSVARHCPGAKPGKDGNAVSVDIFVGPKVEGEEH